MPAALGSGRNRRDDTLSAISALLRLLQARLEVAYPVKLFSGPLFVIFGYDLRVHLFAQL